MKTDLRFVFDTSAIVSAVLLKQSIVRQAFDQADCIVSGDDDLLSLHPFRGILILTPRQFLDHAWSKSSK